MTLWSRRTVGLAGGRGGTKGTGNAPKNPSIEPHSFVSSGFWRESAAPSTRGFRTTGC